MIKDVEVSAFSECFLFSNYFILILLFFYSSYTRFLHELVCGLTQAYMYNPYIYGKIYYLVKFLVDGGIDSSYSAEGVGIVVC